MRLFWYLAVTGAVVLWMDDALAQRHPIADDTLGNERSIVTPEDNIRGRPGDRIEGGARRGDNLFHSFQEFNIEARRAVYFDDPGVINILSRVTGGNVSDIQGTLGVLGDANLFLINPSGIIFGPGARLDVGGSFMATTADSFVFENGFAFSATNPQAPPFLTVSVPIGLQYGTQTPGAIVNQGSLNVNSGQSLILAGGEITLDNGRLDARNLLGGRIELGSVSGTGTVELEQSGSILSLSIPQALARSDVRIINGSVIDARAGDGGSISVTAQKLDILGRNLIAAGIGREQGTANSQAGDIVLDATDTITVGTSLIANVVLSNAIGDAGNLRITAGALIVEGSQFQTRTLGQGDAGDVIISARNQVLFDDGTVLSRVEEGAIGRGGNITIDTNSLEVRNGTQLTASTFGEGNAGDVIINADDQVVFAGTNADGDLSSGTFSRVGQRGIGRGGNITIDTNSLEVRNGAQLTASTFGEGNAGDVVINAADRVLFDGTNADGGLFSSAFSSVGQRGVGRGGNITIDTNSLEVRNGAQLSTGTFGEGNAGDVVINAADRVVFTVTSKAFSTVGAINFRGVAVGNGGDIRIRTDSLEVVRDAQLQASTFARGNAGDVIIHANNRVLFDGTNSTAFSRLEEGAIGRGGRIVINTNSLIVRNGAELTASTFGRGNAGNIRIAARDVSLDGTGNDGFSSGLFTSTTGPTGRGGEITVRADSIRLTDGAVVNAQTFNDFRGGNITLSADTFDATNGGQIITTTTDSGRAGNITLNVTDRVTLSGADRQRTSGLFANTAEGSSGRGGTIRIRTGELNISDRAEIVASSQGSGIAGNIDVTAQSIELDRGRLTAETNTVEGGNIAIATDSLSLTNNAQISVNSVAEDEGGAGDIEVQARNIELDEASEITAETASGQGGNITLSNLELLRLRNGSRISTTAGTQQAGGDGGNINIDADFIVAFSNENSDITANAFEGRGGNVDITTEGLFGIKAQDQLTDFSDITASSEQGVQGTININTPDVDPSRGLTELPEDVVDASNQIAQTCPTDGDIAGEVGEFVVTGRGGLPADPAELLGGETVLSELAEVDDGADREDGMMRGEIDRSSEITNNEQAELVEAQGWVVSAEGKVVLTAENPAIEPHGLPIAPVSCPSS